MSSVPVDPLLSNESGPTEDKFEGKVFVGGLSWQTTADTLRGYFQHFGELADTVLMVDKMTGQPRGFGFVTFADPAGMA